MLAKKIFKGTVYIALGNYSGVILSIIVSGILARILSPSDFGVVAIAAIFSAFFSLLSDMGLGVAIIQFKGLSEEEVSDIFVFSLFTGMALAVSFFLASPVISSFYNEPVLDNICKILSLQIFFVTLNTVPDALLFRAKKFNIIGIRRFLVHFFCGFLAVVCAGKIGIYSLLIVPVLGAILQFLVNFCLSGIKIVFRFKIESLKKIFSFSFYYFLFGITDNLTGVIDKLIIGKYLNSVELGYYEKSYKLVQLPLSQIVGNIVPVINPYLTDYQDNHEYLYNLYVRFTKILITLSFPLAVLLVFSGHELILIIFGNKWEKAVLPFQILSLIALIQMPASITSIFFRITYRTKLLLVCSLISLMIFAVVIFSSLVLFSSIVAVACGYFISLTLMYGVMTYTISNLIFHKKISGILKLFIRPCILGLTQALLLYGIYWLLPAYTNLMLLLAIKIIAWAVINLFLFQYLSDYKPSYYYKMVLKYIKNH